MSNFEEQYQEDGFQLVVYTERKPVPYTSCSACGRALFHLASLFDEWGEKQSRTLEYYFCKKCRIIEKKTFLERPDGINEQTERLHHPPHQAQVELLAQARYYHGHSISLLTLNKHWWRPRRYPLVLGKLLGPEAPRVRPLRNPYQSEGTRLVDEEVQRNLPMPRYTPAPEVTHNPFTSRQKSATTTPTQKPLEAASDSDGTMPDKS